MSGYVKIFKVKDGDQDQNTKLMSFCVDDEKLLEKYKAIWSKITELKNTELNALPACDRYIKTKVRTYSEKVDSNFCGLYLPEDEYTECIECEPFTQSCLLFSHTLYENKYYLEVYLDNCAYKIPNKQMTNYLDENLIL